MFRTNLTREELGPLYKEDIPEEYGYYYVAEQTYGGLYYEKIMHCRLISVYSNSKTVWTSYRQRVYGQTMSRMMDKKRRFLVGPKVKSLMELI